MTRPNDNPQDAPDAMLEHRIRTRAQEIYLRRQKDPALFDWLLAEAEIRAEMCKPSYAEDTQSPR
jgi:hypothetical protein